LKQNIFLLVMPDLTPSLVKRAVAIRAMGWKFLCLFLNFKRHEMNSAGAGIAKSMARLTRLTDGQESSWLAIMGLVALRHVATTRSTNQVREPVLRDKAMLHSL
jgi:hypothetical protein